MKNTIIHGDALDVMRQIPKGSVPLIITSPPYNLGQTSGGGLKGAKGVGKWASAKLADGYDKHDDAMPYSQYVEWQRDCLGAMMSLLSDDGALFYNHKWRVQKGLIQDRSEIVSGFPVRQIIIWRRKGGINFNRQYFLPTYEVVYMIAKKDFKLNKGASGIGDVWDIGQEMKNGHPAPFPVELPRRIIAATSAGLVLDPFCGSGTTCLAAKELHRDFIGIDNSLEYVNLAKSRVGSRRKVFCRGVRPL